MPSCSTCGASIDEAVRVCARCGTPETATRAAEPISAATTRKLVAAFNSQSTWAGKQVVYDGQRLSVEGAPLSAGKLIGCEKEAWLDWAHEELRGWVCELAEWERASQPQTQVPDRPPSESAGFLATTPTVPEEEDEPPTNPTPGGDRPAVRTAQSPSIPRRGPRRTVPPAGRGCI